jgi:hypothetical protein
MASRQSTGSSETDVTLPCGGYGYVTAGRSSTEKSEICRTGLLVRDFKCGPRSKGSIRYFTKRRQHRIGDDPAREKKGGQAMRNSSHWGGPELDVLESSTGRDRYGSSVVQLLAVACDKTDPLGMDRVRPDLGQVRQEAECGWLRIGDIVDEDLRASRQVHHFPEALLGARQPGSMPPVAWPKNRTSSTGNWRSARCSVQPPPIRDSI